MLQPRVAVLALALGWFSVVCLAPAAPSITASSLARQKGTLGPERTAHAGAHFNGPHTEAAAGSTERVHARPATRTPGEHAHSRAATRGPSEYARARQGNVRHFPFSGKVQVQNGSQEAVTMHVYIKSVVSGGRASFRGFMFAESVERDWFSYLDGYVCQPDVAHADWPSIFVREGDAIVEHPLRVHTELIYGHNVAQPARGTSNYMRKCMPYPFEGEITLQSPDAEFHLRLQGFRKVAAYSAGRALPKPGQMVQPHGRPKLAPGATPNNATSGPRVAIVLYPFTLQVKQEVANALLYQFVRYHAYLGFRVLQYTQPMHLPGFLADEQLRGFVRAGQLELVLWDHLGECDGPPHMRCWQPIVYSHAILEAWGQPALTRMLISDIDEYFVFPTRTMTLDLVLQKCTMNKAQVTVMRYDAFSERDPAVQNASLPQGERDLSLWLHRAPGEPHPLELYRWRSARPIALGKNMVDPARVAAYEVHNGIVWTVEQEAEKVVTSPKCGILLHLVNLFADRYTPDEKVVQDQAWQWVFQAPA